MSTETLHIPELALVVLIGPSGSGKSTFARKHFLETEIVSSDRCRGIVSNDENNQAVTKDAFDLVHFIIRKRLKLGLLTVVDATNVQPESRRSLLELAKEFHCLPVALVLDMPEALCHARNAQRPDRAFGTHVVRQQRSQLRRSLKSLKREGFRTIHVMRSEEEVNELLRIERDPLFSNQKHETGPFDIIGDVHGCLPELEELLVAMDYQIERVPYTAETLGYRVTHPVGRRVVFVGDLVDRGPDSPGVLKLAMSMVASGAAFCVVGNHDAKLQRYLRGKEVSLKHGLEVTAEQLKAESEEFKTQAREFLYQLTSHYVLDEGRLVVAHAGIKEDMQGRGSGAVRSFCMYGETTGEIDEFGLPVRLNWAADYRGKAKVVYGHTPVPEAQWLNRTIDIDTGCVFGGKLTALRYPEETLVSIPAREVYCEPVKPLALVTDERASQQIEDDLLDIQDVMGKRIIGTRLNHNLTIREEHSLGALEVMSRFAMNPKWLVYLPPTMSPTETSPLPGYLEHPAEALAYYRSQGIAQVVCEEKHMGSRAIVVVCRDEEVAVRRFGIAEGGVGACYTRTGRNFFNDAVLEAAFFTRLRAALSKANFWEQQDTDWVCLDTELMPWSAKARGLLKDQYAAVGAAGTAGLAAVNEALALAQARGLAGIDTLQTAYGDKQERIVQFREAYRQYCWPVASLEDYRLAPFHVLATEGALHTHKPHTWHMETIHALCAADPSFLMATPYHVVDLAEEKACEAVIHWWTQLTEKGGEGMVVKPLDYEAQGRKGLVQPAVKCRGSEYLRIIYEPDYSTEDNLSTLKNRGLGRKRSLAMREFALGIEGLERFIRKEPLRRVHECVFGVLALESEPVDPRL